MQNLSFLIKKRYTLYVQYKIGNDTMARSTHQDYAPIKTLNFPIQKSTMLEGQWFGHYLFQMIPYNLSFLLSVCALLP